jgi:hypothetical protein
MKKLFLLLTITACGRGPKGDVGAQGPQGPKGDAGINGVVDVLNPCGPEGAFEEILLRLNTGEIIAVFDGGPHKDRLVVLTYPNSYSTTDGFNCEFELDENGELVL